MDLHNLIPQGYVGDVRTARHHGTGAIAIWRKVNNDLAIITIKVPPDNTIGYTVAEFRAGYAPIAGAIGGASMKFRSNGELYVAVCFNDNNGSGNDPFNVTLYETIIPASITRQPPYPRVWTLPDLQAIAMTQAFNAMRAVLNPRNLAERPTEIRTALTALIKRIVGIQ